MDQPVISLKKFFLISFLASLLFFIYFISQYFSDKTQLVFCNVGQGDGIYLRVKNRIDVVIDAGPNKLAMINCLGKYMPFWDKQIELAILSHPNKDHYQGFFEIINRYQIKKFTTVNINQELTSKDYQKLINLIKNKSIPFFYSDNQKEILFDKTKKIRFFWPPKNFFSKNDNDYSLIFVYQESNFRGLFTGDINSDILERLLEQSLKNVDLLKIPHHGSKYGITRKIISLANPKVAVISVGGKNSYGHPHSQVLEILKAKKIKIRRTDLEGDIKMIIKN